MTIWEDYVSIDAPSTVLAVAVDRGRVWAGGVGGVAGYHEGGDGAWQSLRAGLPLTSVTALCYAGGWLMAGGPGGLARSADGGRRWESAHIAGPVYPVSALVASPEFRRNGCALAATLGAGIYRSEDAGRTWKPASFGLQAFEVLALAWRDDDVVLAAADDGIYRSPNGGRAWQTTRGAEWEGVAALALAPDSALAALETGVLLRSTDGGQTWRPIDGAPGALEGLHPLALVALDAEIWLLSTLERGLLRTGDAGATWQSLAPYSALTFGPPGEALYAGVEDGLVRIAGRGVGRLPSPPLHDLHRLLVAGERLLVYGLHSGLRVWEAGGWRAAAEGAGPLTALAIAPDGAWVLSGGAGLLRSTDAGRTWETVVAGEAGMVAHLTFRPDGAGWAGSADGTRLFQTRDCGATWEALDAPFGVLPLAALQATPDMLIAATYDGRTRSAELWNATADGVTWQRGARATTPWPIVATAAQPPLLTLGGLLFVLGPNGAWEQHRVGDGAGVRRLVSDGKTLYALTPNGLLQSPDLGATWAPLPDAPPPHTILDLATGEDALYLLLGGGRVLRGPLA